MELQILEVDTHLSIKAVGQYSLADLYDLFVRVKEESEKRGDKKVILDVTGVAGAVPVMDMHMLGEHCSRVWKLPFRIAIVSPEWGVNRFFENVAWNRGIRLAVVPDEASAMKWLK